MKLKTLLLGLLLSTSLISTTYADMNDGWKAYYAKDYATAFKEWKPFAEKGDSVAQNNLGSMYASGEGTLKDYKKSFYWSKKSAEQGIVNSMTRLGRLYDNGKGVAKDKYESINWYTLAGNAGDVSAQFTLGLLYAHTEYVVLLDLLGDKDGVVVDKDLGMSRYWIDKTYNNNDSNRFAKLNITYKKMAKRVWEKLELWKY